MAGKGLTTDFPLVEKGYDPTQVDEYLASQMLQLREQVDSASTRVAELETELAAAREREDAIQLTMMAATRARNELLDKAKDDAEVMVAEARRESFVLMTESRKDADRTIEEGKAMVADARTEALGVVNEAEQETERLMAARQVALDKLHTEYEAEGAALIDRINTRRPISDDMVAKAAPAAEPAPAPQAPPTEDEVRTADVSQTENEPAPKDASEAPTAERIRESFSGRRSAKLPRIGEEAGRSALAAANAMRAHLTHEPDDSDSDEGDLAARTA